MEFLKYELNFLCLKKSSSSKTDIFWSDEYWEAACYWLRAFYCWIIRYETILSKKIFDILEIAVIITLILAYLINQAVISLNSTIVLQKQYK